MNSVQQSAQQFVSEVRRRGISVTAAYLFGSQAKGNAKAESDIDICIVSPDLGKDPIDEMTRLRVIAFPIDARIEPIPLNPEDWEDRYSSLVWEIRTFGKRIVIPS